jgi:ribulose-phosphate 3-epimerase
MTRSEVIDNLRQPLPQLTIGTLTTDDQAAALATLAQEGVALVHVDIMDGKIWPKTTVGPDFVAGLATGLVKDVHLLVDKPEEQIISHAAAGAGAITFCVEYTDDIDRCLALIEQGGDHILRGVSLNPDTPLEVIRPHLDRIDLVFLLAIGPETGKETFFDTLPPKVARLREWKPGVLISIDGAIKKDNVGEVAGMGPDLIATGSAVFDGTDAAANIREMNASIRQALTA